MTTLNNIENTGLQELPNVPGAFLAPLPMSEVQKLIGNPKKIKKGEEEAYAEKLLTNIFTKLVVDADGKVFEAEPGRPIENHKDIVDNLTSTTINKIVTDIGKLVSPDGDRLGK